MRTSWNFGMGAEPWWMVTDGECWLSGRCLSGHRYCWGSVGWVISPDHHKVQHHNRHVGIRACSKLRNETCAYVFVFTQSHTQLGFWWEPWQGMGMLDFFSTLYDPTLSLQPGETLSNYSLLGEFCSPCWVALPCSQTKQLHTSVFSPVKRGDKYGDICRLTN